MGSWESEAERNRVAHMLLKHARMNHLGLWGLQGPTDRAWDYLKSSPLSSGQQVMLKVCWDVWNGEGRCTLFDILHRLDARLGRLVGSMIEAQANGYVGDWLRTYET